MKFEMPREETPEGETPEFEGHIGEGTPEEARRERDMELAKELEAVNEEIRDRLRGRKRTDDLETRRTIILEARAENLRRVAENRPIDIRDDRGRRAA